ncbi:hypothetical protein D3227_20655 [Mesorhizobium waimense]|uniref:Uncharacterized protein n=1 Tax=Mesorhizobium waimense TaxID=1300307 RepID=A0A3A5KXW9_9HYPH|nr:hypothetical protein D3227_20655 [Mesorhizobium waimense]
MPLSRYHPATTVFDDICRSGHLKPRVISQTEVARHISNHLYFSKIRIMLSQAVWGHWIEVSGFEGVSAMEFASCFDQSGTVLASTIFLSITAVFIILAAFAAARLITTSGAGSIERLRTA